MSGSADTQTQSEQQPEEFPIENVLADYMDLFTAKISGSFTNVVWVNPNGNGGEEFNKSNFFNRVDLNKKYDINQDLHKLSQLQLAAITPTVLLYRRDYSGESLDDYKDRLFLFNNVYPKGGDAAFLRQQAEFSAGSGADPTLMGAAMTNIQYTFAGRNPVESERAIDVTITMKFASFEALVGRNTAILDLNKDLVGKQKGQAGKYPSDITDYTDTGGANSNSGVTYNFLSLITHPPSDTQLKEFDASMTEGVRVYYPNKFRVYLRLGWRAIVNSEVFPDSFKQFTESINKGEHDKGLLLNLINHELSFNEEGEVELKVNYIGSLDTSLTSGDSDFMKALLEIKMKEVEAESKAVTESNSAIKSVELLNKWINQGCAGKDGVKSDDPIDTQRKALNEKIEDKKEKYAEKKQEAINDVFAGFLKLLTDQGALKDFNNIFALAMSGDSAKAFATSMFSPGRDRLLFDNIIKASQNVYSATQAQTDAQSSSKTAQSATKAQEAGTAGSTEKFFGADLRSVQAAKTQTDPWGSNAAITQKFKLVTVGSLIDGLMYTLKTSFENSAKQETKDFLKSFCVILGDYYYYPRGETGSVLLPISKILISFDSFLVWYKDNVVAKQRKNYVIKDFLTDFFTGVVVPSLKGFDSAGLVGRQYSVYFDQRTVKASPQDDKPFKLNEDRSIDNTLVASYASGSAATAKDCNIIYISMKVSDPDASGRKFVNLQKDNEEGISHFWVGDTRGMIKSIKFKRVEQPGLKEAKATKEAFIPLNQLRDLYNTDISMFGNHYYYPGDMVFIHPQNSILGEPYKKGSISNIMGIGGYYDIIKVSSNIGEGGYETNLECVWTCSGEEFVKSDQEKAIQCNSIQKEYASAITGSGISNTDSAIPVLNPSANTPVGATTEPAPPAGSAP